MTAFFTSIVLSCSVARYIAACILHMCLSACLCLSWLYTFLTKTNRIYKREFSGVSKEASPILDPRTSTSNKLNRRGKNLRQPVQKWMRKRKRKIIGVAKRYALTPKDKNSQRFLKTSVF